MANNVSRRSFLKTVTLSGSMTAGAMVLAACGGGGSPAPTQPAAGGAAVTLDIGSKGDTLEFDKTALEAPASSKITLNFKNNSQPSANLLHNWVLIKAGASPEAVEADGVAAGEANGYLKPNDDRVLANTALIKGGESATITFDAPPAGTYDYVCTFPGHGVLMKGKLTIQ